MCATRYILVLECNIAITHWIGQIERGKGSIAIIMVIITYMCQKIVECTSRISEVLVQGRERR